MLIDSYDLKIDVSGHSSEVFEYEAIAHLQTDIREVLPYLNATLRSGLYLPDAPAFSWRKDDHKIGFWPDRIAVETLESREQASEKIRELVDLVNDVWARRAEIEPDYTMRQNLQPLELFKLLPQTNCKVCGEASCFAFALKLAAGQVQLTECEPVLTEEQHSERKDRLEELIRIKRPLL
jgi:ArsR family metal-binding transcriptional regulator